MPHAASGGTNRASGRKMAFGLVIGIFAVIAVVYALMARASSDEGAEAVPTVAAKRGPLTVSITEGGTLHAMEKLEIKSEVEGNNQILEIVPEGTVITEDDVNLEDPTKGKMLVRLDTAGMEEKKASGDISYYNAEASYTQAQKAYEIQVKENESNETQARLTVKFAEMDLQKYLGEKLAAEVLENEGVDFQKLRRDAIVQVSQILDPEGDNPEDVRTALGALHMEVPASEGNPLGGEAAQRLRELASDLQLARQRLEQAEDTLQWTKVLVEGEYVNKTELTRDELDRAAKKVQVDGAEEALRLFLQYTLPKDAEQRYSDLAEARSQLDRVLAQNASELAQAEANRRAKEASFQLEKNRKEKLERMLAGSVIYATKPGLVVYADTSGGRWSSGDPIQEGTTIRENQTILTIPNLNTLAARVNVHETDIEKVKVGQKARITVEALQGSSLTGKVERISPMASSENRWLNPDVIVYETDIALDQAMPGLTPGMSATAEIIVAELKNVVYVPLSAVTTYRGQRVCWVKRPDGEPELREIEAGYFTEKFVEVREGLREGELVYLAPPRELEEEQPGEEATEEQPAESQQPGEPQEPRMRPEGPRPGAPGGQEQEPQANVNAEAIRRQMEALQGLPEEERRAKMREIMEGIPRDQRMQLMQQFGGGRRGEGGPGRKGRPGGARGGEGQPERQPQ